MNAGQAAAFSGGWDLQTWLEHLEQHSQVLMGLDRVAAVYHRLLPAGLAMPAVVVGGTNGKGSTVAYLEAIYRIAGYRTGAYFSPHLERFNERLVFDGRPVDDQSLCAAFEQVASAAGETPLTYFEFTTLAAFWLMEQQAVDVALLEVGLGGRLDAVNVVDAAVAVVTSIGTDHADWLGEGREAVGYEKAGIARTGRPMLCGDPDPPSSFLEAVAAHGGVLYRLGGEFGHARSADAWTCRLPGGRLLEGLPLPRMPGSVQLDNAACALSAVSLLRQKLPVAETALRGGIGAAFQPARLEHWIRDGVVWVVDVAHNLEAMQVLVAELTQRHRVPGRRHMLFAAYDDKPIEAMVALLADHVDHWRLAPLGGKRAASLGRLEAAVRTVSTRPIDTFGQLDPALESLHDTVCPGDEVVAAGSFAVAGPVRCFLRQHGFVGVQDFLS
jgi:dihydrofolate synthase/folylpolyglutamate synthase